MKMPILIFLIWYINFYQIEFKDIQFEHEVQVSASAGVGKWNVLNYNKNESYTVRCAGNPCIIMIQ